METKQYLPAGLWDCLQSICWNHDNQFIKDVSRIIRVPVSDLKKRVFGPRGTLTTIVTTDDPWWTHNSCPVVEKRGNMWIRCNGVINSCGTCFEHLNTIHNPQTKYFDNIMFADMLKRYSFKYENNIYWAAEDGSVLNSCGLVRKDLKFDLKTKLLIINNVCGSKEAKKTEPDCIGQAADESAKKTESLEECESYQTTSTTD